MDSLYYTVEERSDGWHAHPTDGDALDEDDRVFPSHDDAIAWCHGNGLIPLLQDEHEIGYAFDLGDPFV
ncbi:MAG TPA: hypothetical protein VEL07_03935 [Planctomycetota bacterium]|nr:hypothetical protein [Planctomycetota bacterium]